MIIARKKLQLQRLWRQRGCRVTTYICLGVLVLFGFVYNNKGKTFSSLDSNSAALKFDDLDELTNKELPGGPDPNTIFRDGELGNYEPKTPEIPSNQPGEHGRPVPVTDEEGMAAGRAAEKEFGFNTYVSDLISMNRTIPDIRPKECKHWDYPENLPTVSVVIVFHNEGWTPLLRTVHSVLLRSPPELIESIVMVDDDSDKPHLKEKLDKYVTRFNGKVIVVRTEQREGLINARSIGAKHSTGEVVLFLDAHCEVNTNWLPPLLAPIKQNRKVMTVPVIDGIDSNSWEYRSVYGSPNAHHSGIFEWGLLYKETQITERESAHRQHNSQPFRSPTHAGGLFAINRLWFKELGYYDEGLQIWGGEQYELSFKIWQCGGGIVFVPCSHVGHVYRSHMPYGFGKFSGKPVISINMMRVVKTWMDDYSKYYLTREPQAAHVNPGDISAQLALRDKLQCKSFKWYMENVAYDVLKSYPLLPPNDVWGEARNPATGKCLDRMGGIPGPLGASGCHGYGGNQLIRLNVQGQMAQGEWCLTANGIRIQANHCVKGSVSGNFVYDRNTQQIQHNTKRMCITISEAGSDVSLETCTEDNQRQKFVWKEYYQSS
ncbi:hypothetical protein GCK72_019251 [Caenorhabditis remanei]|uniref:Polypeptide N-acetylgalactosaminyltransferase n=1 Tax=Caenorhabditis remanei TaxID=31234 RepID=A0A6A5GD30_CAERE|nr:hypothetical protein GCK72_019251 [Caenorhabditis remanei]KAF1752696.1 hypothetical protein GCK72_019251 [Caenorhabditis remanei]